MARKNPSRSRSASSPNQNRSDQATGRPNAGRQGGQFAGDDEIGWHFARQQEAYDFEGTPPERDFSIRSGREESLGGGSVGYRDPRDFGGPAVRRATERHGRSSPEPRQGGGGLTNPRFGGSRAQARRDDPRLDHYDDERRSAQWSRHLPPSAGEESGDYDDLPDERRSYATHRGFEEDFDPPPPADPYRRHTEDDEYAIGFSPGSAAYDPNDEDEDRYFSGRGHRHEFPSPAPQDPSRLRNRSRPRR